MDANTGRGDLGTTITVGFAVGAAATLVFALADAITAAVGGTAVLTLVSCLACTAAAISLYAQFIVSGAVILALATHRWLAPRAVADRVRLLSFAVLGVCVFTELYWWTRPYLFYGHAARSPERIAASAGVLVVALVVAWFLARPFARVAGRFAVIAAALLVVLAFAGGSYRYAQRDVTAARGLISDRTRDVPNVLLIVVDAMRQDKLGCYGDTRVKTPNIDRLAADGVVFENAFTQAPFTWSSFGSFLTGKYPRRHGLVRMAAGARMVPNVTLPLHLRGAQMISGKKLEDGDFIAASFHTGTLSTGSGLLRGFDVYYEQMAGHGLVTTDSPWSVFRSDLLIEIIGSKFAQKIGGDVAGTARAWLAENGLRRFCAMVHLYSTHTPYDSPEEFKRSYCDPKYSGPFRSFYAEQREAIDHGSVKPTTADIQQIRDLYAAGVSEADAKIGAIVDELSALHVLDSTIVVVMSDHGESLGESGLGEALGERGLWEHNHMVQTNLRIPLVMRFSRGIPPRVRVGTHVDEIDLLPTLSALMGLQPPAVGVTDVNELVDGKSALALVHGSHDALRPYSFAENGTFMSIQDERWKLVVPSELVGEAQWATRATPDGRKSWLVDLAHDPGEEHNLLDAHLDDANRLAEALKVWSDSMPGPRMEWSDRDYAEMRERLEKLGYPGGVGQDVHALPKQEH